MKSNIPSETVANNYKGFTRILNMFTEAVLAQVLILQKLLSMLPEDVHSSKEPLHMSSER